MKVWRILAALLVIGLLFSLAACNSKSPLSGKYVIKDITDDPDGTTFVELEAMYKEMDLDIQDFLCFEFSDGYQFTLTIFGDAESGTYTRNGKTLTLTADRLTKTATVSGNKITMNYKNGTKMIFEKKK